MVTGQVVHEEDGMRFVELSASYSRYSYAPVERKLVRFSSQGYDDVVLIDVADGVQKQVIFTREELGALISAYRSYLADEEASRAQAFFPPSSDPWEDGSESGDDDDFPF